MPNPVGSLKASVKGDDKLTLEITLDPKGRISGSGKSMVHATTAGFTTLPNGMRISYNVISGK